MEKASDHGAIDWWTALRLMYSLDVRFLNQFMALTIQEHASTSHRRAAKTSWFRECIDFMSTACASTGWDEDAYLLTPLHLLP